MKLRPQRVNRLRNELRLWLRDHYGRHLSYGKHEIDCAREALGFDDVDDAMIAYTFFGPDLMPDFLASLGQSLSPDELSELIDAVTDAAIDVADLVDGDLSN